MCVCVCVCFNISASAIRLTSSHCGLGVSPVDGCSANFFLPRHKWNDLVAKEESFTCPTGAPNDFLSQRWLQDRFQMFVSFYKGIRWCLYSEREREREIFGFVSVPIEGLWERPAEEFASGRAATASSIDWLATPVARPRSERAHKSRSYKESFVSGRGEGGCRAGKKEKSTVVVSEETDDGDDDDGKWTSAHAKSGRESNKNKSSKRGGGGI